MSLWNEKKIEVALKKRLKKDLGEHDGKEIFHDYCAARRVLLEEILPEIKSQEPNLSDHGPDHIAQVLDRVHQLFDGDFTSVTTIELYILCISVLFHDVGNLKGRKKHNKKIAEIYDLVRPNKNRFARERAAVLAIAGAHTGFCNEGTPDTIKDLDFMGVLDQTINCKVLAAILRFADELAEGPVRTSYVMQALGLYADDSLPFHRLANCTNYTIDKERGRILVDYDINIEVDDNGEVTDGGIPLAALVDLIQTRILKINEERKYCMFYADQLKIFKEISISIKFNYESEYIDIDLKPIIINDLVVPGKVSKNDTIIGYTSTDICALIIKSINNEGGS